MKDTSRIVRVTTRLAVILTAAITLVVPLVYFASSYQRLVGQLVAEAEINGRIVSNLINTNPEMWRFEQLRLEELLARRPQSGEEETRRILDIDGKVIAASGKPLIPPLVVRTGDLKDAGVTAGLIEISRSLRPLMARTALMALLGLALGMAVFVTLRILPIRAVIRAQEELRLLNEELELKVEERTRQLQEAQEELVRKEKLSIIGQLSGSVGHELRNPLGVMSNAVYFLKTVTGGGDETVAEYLGIIEKEIANSLRIINDLLDFARTKPPSRQAVTPAELIGQRLERCTIPENVTLTVDVPEDLPSLNIDPLQMGQVLMNFITNGVQAMAQGGFLRVGARKVRGTRSEERGKEKILEPRSSNLEPDGNFVEISVEDTGEGITIENMKKLFQPLFTTKPRGIGLGLVVCKNLVEANGGRIEVESEVGKGTTFRVVLPAEE